MISMPGGINPYLQEMLDRELLKMAGVQYAQPKPTPQPTYDYPQMKNDMALLSMVNNRGGVPQQFNPMTAIDQPPEPFITPETATPPKPFINPPAGEKFNLPQFVTPQGTFALPQFTSPVDPEAGRPTTHITPPMEPQSQVYKEGAKGGEMEKLLKRNDLVKYGEYKPHWQELSSTDLPREWENKPITKIDYFSVPQEQQGKGIGRQMLEKIEQEARDKGHRGIIITLPTDEGSGFYKHMGYKQSTELGAVVYKDLSQAPKITFSKGDKVIYEAAGEKREVTISSKESSDLAYKGGKGWKIKLPDGQNMWVSESNLSKLSPKEGK